MQSVVKSGVVLGCLGVAFLPISAQRWLRVYESTDIGVVYIDAQSKLVDGGRIRYTGKQAGAPYQVIAICSPPLRADGELPRQRETPAYDFVTTIDWMKNEVAAACNLPAEAQNFPAAPAAANLQPAGLSINRTLARRKLPTTHANH